MKVREEETLSDGKKKQEVEVADESDVDNVVLWEGDTGKLEDGVFIPAQQVQSTIL